jgi:hypothetical protein
MGRADKKPESQLLAEVTAAIEQVEEGRRARFIAAVSTYFGISEPLGADRRGSRAVESTPPPKPSLASEFTGFEDLYDRCSPSKNADKAAVGGYWFQVIQSHETFTAQEVNAVLKNVGHGLGNITDSFSALQESKPALARQVAKSGKARQARKKYKLTTAGIARVRQLMAGAKDDGE